MRSKVKSRLKSSWRFLLAGCAALSLQSCYLMEQGMGQLQIQWHQVPLEEAIEAEQNPHYRKMLASVPSIKQFSVNVLLLKPTDNYTTYYHTPGKGVSFVVTASAKDQLKPYTWWFPIISSVPYKGFFDKEDALALEAKLKEKGYDTWMFAATAYSTLGWFRDPLTTPMLRRGYESFVGSLIHEMVHTTLYIEGEGDFNEQLASFVETRGMIAYFRHEGLLTEEREEKIWRMKQKRQQYHHILKKAIDQLEALYAQDLDTSVILDRRAEIFEALEAELVRVYPGKSEGYWRFNNARLLQHRRYSDESELFKQMWQESETDWKRFWQLVNRYVREKGWRG